MLQTRAALGEGSGLHFLLRHEDLPGRLPLAVKHVEFDVVEGEDGAVLLPCEFLCRQFWGVDVEVGVLLVIGVELGECGGGVAVGGREEGGL